MLKRDDIEEQLKNHPTAGCNAVVEERSSWF